MPDDLCVCGHPKAEHITRPGSAVLLDCQHKGCFCDEYEDEDGTLDYILDQDESA